MAASFSLIIEDDAGKQIVVPFARDVITIGRKEGNTIRLTERNVSRNHAKLSRNDIGVTVEDLTSFNGVKLNGDRIAGRVQVAAGDVIEIGDYHLELRSNAPAQQTTKLGPQVVKSAGVADAAEEGDEFEGDTQRWEPPPNQAQIPVGGLPTQEAPPPPAFGSSPGGSPFADNSGDTERMDLSAGAGLLSAQQAWPAPQATLKLPDVTSQEMPTAPIVKSSVLTTALNGSPISSASSAIDAPNGQPLGGFSPAVLAGPSALTAPLPPAPAPPQLTQPPPLTMPPSLPELELEPLDDATQDMPLPAARAKVQASFGHQSSSGAAEQTEQLRPAPAPADDLALPRLVVLNTIFSGSTFPLRLVETVLGRTDDNDIVLEHKSVSRNHAKLVREGERVRILDLKSANGILVNGQDIEQHLLRTGDVIELGRVRIRFVPQGERFVVPPDEIERARIADAASDFDDGAGTMNLTAAMRQTLPDGMAPQRPVALYAVVGVLALLVIVLLAVVVMRDSSGDLPTPDTPPPPTPVTAISEPVTPPPQPLVAPPVPPPAPAPDPVVAAPPPAPPPAPVEAPLTPDDASESGDKKHSGGKKKGSSSSSVSSSALVAEAQKLMVNNKNSEAVSVLAPAATGSDPDVHYLLGIAYQRLKRNEDARAHYNKFLQLAPNDKRAEKVRTILGS